MTKNWKKFTGEKMDIFLIKKLHFSYPQASRKDVQATGAVFIPQIKTSRTSKLELSFFTFVGLFGLPGSGSVFPMRIQPTKINVNPCGSGPGSTTLNNTKHFL
jgi:hypothetical protein